MAISTTMLSSDVVDYVNSSTVAYGTTSTLGVWSGTNGIFTPLGLTRDSAELRPEGPRDECARYIAEISAAIGERGERPGNEKNASGKKSGAINAGYNQWRIPGINAPNIGLYQQFAVKGMEPGRPAQAARLRNITSA